MALTSLLNVNRLFWQEWPFVNPCWLLLMILFSSANSWMYSLIIRSNNLPTIDVRLTGLWFSGTCLCLFLNIDTTLAFLQSSSTNPVSMMSTKIRNICSLRTLWCKPSGPGYLFVLSLFSLSLTPASVTHKSTSCDVLLTILSWSVYSYSSYVFYVDNVL